MRPAEFEPKKCPEYMRLAILTATNQKVLKQSMERERRRRKIRVKVGVNNDQQHLRLAAQVEQTAWTKRVKPFSHSCSKV